MYPALPTLREKWADAVMRGLSRVVHSCSLLLVLVACAASAGGDTSATSTTGDPGTSTATTAAATSSTGAGAETQGGSTAVGGTGSTTGSSAGSGTTTGGGGLGPADPPYEECFSQAGVCSDPNAVCLSGGDVAVCAPSCATVSDCPVPVPGDMTCTTMGLCQYGCNAAACPPGMLCQAQTCWWPKP